MEFIAIANHEGRRRQDHRECYQADLRAEQRNENASPRGPTAATGSDVRLLRGFGGAFTPFRGARLALADFP
jgi:hypothetical protein